MFLVSDVSSDMPFLKISELMGDVAKGIKSFKKGMSEDGSNNPTDDNSKSDNTDSENK